MPLAGPDGNSPDAGPLTPTERPTAPLSITERIKLQRLAEAATPGVWRSAWHDEPTANCFDEVAVEAPDSTDLYGKCVVGLLWYDGPHAGCTAENAAYIAEACPAAMLRLLAQLATAEAQAAGLREQLAQARQELAQSHTVEPAGVRCTACGGYTGRAHAYSPCQTCRALARSGSLAANPLRKTPDLTNF